MTGFPATTVRLNTRMTRVRFFIDPSKSDDEIRDAILAIAVEREIDVRELHPTVDQHSADTGNGPEKAPD